MVHDQPVKVLSTNNFILANLAMQSSQSTSVLYAKMLIGSNPSKFSTPKLSAIWYYVCTHVCKIMRHCIILHTYIVYHIAQNFGGVKLCRFRVFGREHVGEFKHLTFSYFSESGIWLVKILSS